MNILVVEEEKEAAAYLRQGLTESGYSVEVALNGTDGLHAAANGDHDLVILDVNLPGIDGFAVLSALRMSRQTPVLMLTARGNTDDKLRGFNLGADDYLAKLFQFPELLARVRALLKRGHAGPIDPIVRVGDLEIDPVRHRATREGQRIVSAMSWKLAPRHDAAALKRMMTCTWPWLIHPEAASKRAVAPNGAKFSGTHGIANVENGSDVQFYLSVDRRRDAGLLSGFVKATAGHRVQYDAGAH